MMLALTLPLLVAPVAAQQPAAPEPVLIAVTQSGLRVEVEEAVPAGARDIPTAFGVLNVPLDPVVRTLTLQDSNAWIEELQADPNLDLEPVLEQMQADGRVEDLLTMTTLLEVRIAEVINEGGPRYEQRLQEWLLCANALEEWGALLDPLDGRMKREKRVPSLWKEVQRQSGAHKLLFSGRMAVELAAYGASSSDHWPVSLADLRRGLRDRDPYLRRAAARIGGQQQLLESSFGQQLLELSVTDPIPLVGDGAAASMLSLWPEETMLFWAHVVGGRGTTSERIAAMRHLVQRGGADGLARLERALNWQYQRKRSMPSGPSSIANLAGSAALEFGRTQAERDREALERRQIGSHARGMTIRDYQVPRLAMPTSLQDSLYWHLGRKTADGQARTREQWLSWLASHRAG